MGTLLAKMHEITLDAFGYITTRVIASHATNEAYMRFQFQKKLAELDAHGGDASLRRMVEAYVARHGQRLTHAQTPVLCHDDYHEGNILVAEDEANWRVTGSLTWKIRWLAIHCLTSQRQTTIRSRSMPPSGRASWQGMDGCRCAGGTAFSSTSSITPSKGLPNQGLQLTTCSSAALRLPAAVRNQVLDAQELCEGLEMLVAGDAHEAEQAWTGPLGGL